MITTTSFILFGNRYELMLDTEKIDRNYDDENYAYWVIERDGKYFEVNIWKDKNGKFTNEGKAHGFISFETFVQAGEADEETDIIFIFPTEK